MPNNIVVNLEKIPRTSDPYLWADYIELLALQNPDKEISRSDIMNRLQERQDFGEADELEYSVDSSTRTPDKWSNALSDWYHHLEYRLGEFKVA